MDIKEIIEKNKEYKKIQKEIDKVNKQRDKANKLVWKNDEQLTKLLDKKDEILEDEIKKHIRQGEIYRYKDEYIIIVKVGQTHVNYITLNIHRDADYRQFLYESLHLVIYTETFPNLANRIKSYQKTQYESFGVAELLKDVNTLIGLHYSPKLEEAIELLGK